MKDTYWHFVKNDRKLGYGDGRIVRAGRTYKVRGKPILCKNGLHASRNPLDALKYSHGCVATLVTLGGYIVHGDDKSVATERTVIWTADATDVLFSFARLCALDVIHLWNPPKVVVDYLKTGDQTIKNAARAAAHAAARAAVAADAAAADAAYVAYVAARAADADADADAAYVAADAAAAYVAADAAAAARAAAADAAAYAARNAARVARVVQSERLTKMLFGLKR